MTNANFIETIEHGLELKADPFHTKLIAEAISDYVEKHGLDDFTTLNDFRFNLEMAYQEYHNLNEDDFDYTETDRIFLSGEKQKKNMTTEQMQEKYEVIAFAAPLVIVKRKSDNVEGTLQFDHRPRFYYDFIPKSLPKITEIVVE